MKKKEIVNFKQGMENDFLEGYQNINLLGQPGYRNSYGKSGLGYFETQTELARMKGLFIRWMFTGKFRTHNPIFLFIMFFLGLLLGAFPLVAILIELIVSKDLSIIGVLFLGFPYIAIGLALLVNVFLSLIDRDGKSITGD